MEEQQIIQIINNFFINTDERKWNNVESTMSDSVLLDFTSMAGGSPQMLSPNQIISSWKTILPGFDRTHHQITNFATTVNGNVANVHYTGKADHYLDHKVWTVEATYDTELINENRNWLITKHTLNLTAISGDTSLPEKAKNIVKNKGSQ